MSALTNTNMVSREEMLKILEFHFLTKNYNENYLVNLTDTQLQVEYKNYTHKEDYQNERPLKKGEYR